MKSRLPGYERKLSAYHRAFAAELREIIHSLPMAEGQAVLDMACGDGAYIPWLAGRVGASGRIVAADLSPDFLEVARGEDPGEGVEFARASIDALPFPAGTFDLCWCAQSFYSLPDPIEALRHLVRVTKPGGVVAVLENDTLHHAILPWPIEVELAVRVAELGILAEDTQQPRKYYVGRDLRSVFRRAGLVDFSLQTFAHDRLAPLGPDVRLYLSEYLRTLLEKVSDRVDSATLRKLEALSNPDSPEALENESELTATFIVHLACGRKPN